MRNISLVWNKIKYHKNIFKFLLENKKFIIKISFYNWQVSGERYLSFLKKLKKINFLKVLNFLLRRDVFNKTWINMDERFFITIFCNRSTLSSSVIYIYIYGIAVRNNGISNVNKTFRFEYMPILWWIHLKTTNESTDLLYLTFSWWNDR